MEDESSSSNSNAAEQVGGTGYKCPRCSREFKSGRTRGGHQNVHCERPPLTIYNGIKLEDLHPVLAEALIHQCDEPETSNKPPTDQPPETEVQPEIKAGADGSSSEQQNNTSQPNPKAKRGSSSSEPRPYKKPRLELCTIDYLAEWNSTWNVEDGAASSSASIPSELQLFPTNPDKPDLELKLGY
ncbi:hypothetical protein ACOSP7_028643 [Xanthoceras sorbifolium]